MQGYLPRLYQGEIDKHDDDDYTSLVVEVDVFKLQLNNAMHILKSALLDTKCTIHIVQCLDVPVVYAC